MKAIFFTDVHLVSKTNVNRVDNLPETQKLKLKELINICNNGDVDVALSTALSLLSNEVIKLMDNRELKPINFSIPEQPQTLTIKTSDGSSTEEIQF